MQTLACKVSVVAAIAVDASPADAATFVSHAAAAGVVFGAACSATADAAAVAVVFAASFAVAADATLLLPLLLLLQLWFLLSLLLL